MSTNTKQSCRKKNYNKVGFELKLFIIDQIHNGRISLNYASKKYDISRATIQYWIKKYSTLEQKKKGMSKQDEIKKLKEKIEELEFVKDFQQDVIADMEIITGVDMSKNVLPKTLAEEIQKKKQNRFYQFLKTHRLLVPRTKRHHITTDSNHHFHKYKNLISNKTPTRAEQLWVTDITYIKTQNGHSYLALVTDAYSKKIMGYKLDSHMRTSLCIEALEMAIKNRKYPSKKLIHHSDRGLQYCNPTYTQFAESNGLIMSMTQKYDPYENAIAERINRTLKYEYALKLTIKNTKLAQKMAKKAVNIYNNLRPHWSLDLKTPNHVHLNQNVPYKSYRRNKSNLELLTI